MKKSILKFPVSQKQKPKRKTVRASLTAARSAPIEGAVMQAVRELVLSRGFEKITEKAVIKRSGVSEMDYRAAFKNRDELLKHFCEKHDYWLSNLGIGIVGTLGYETFFEQIVINLMYSLHDDPIMRRMLIWGLASDNAVTRHIAELRESANRELIKYLEKHAGATGVDIPTHAALLLGGVYYMVMQSGRGTACNIDFSSPKGKKRMANAISFAAGEIFSKHMFPDGNGTPMLRLLKNDTKG